MDMDIVVGICKSIKFL